ncbi:MAG: alpha/beta fold hydrolase [Burkholderiaceae bacterium]
MSDAAKWLSVLHGGESPKVRLLCIPYSGADAHAFASWKVYMPPEVELVAVHLPGRGKRLGEPRDAALEDIADSIAGTLQAMQPLPTVMFGHSLGGLLCYETARRVEAAFAPGLLRHAFFSGCRSPAYHVDKLPADADDLLDESIRRRIRRYKGTPSAVLDDPEALELFLPLLRDDFRMIERYRPVSPAPLKAPATVFVGTEESITDEEVAQWASFTEGGFSSRRIVGGHFFIKSNRTVVVRRLFAEIEATTGIRHRPAKPVKAIAMDRHA